MTADDRAFECIAAGAYPAISHMSLFDLLAIMAQRIQRIEQERENTSVTEECAYRQGVIDGVKRAEAEIVAKFELKPKVLQRGPDPDHLPEGW